MSPILTGTKDSLLAFVTAKLPKTIDAKLPPREMLEVAKRLNTDLATQLQQKKMVLDADSQSCNFYVYLDKDARSVGAQNPSIRSIAEEQLPKLEAGLKMLEDKRLSSLPDTLVSCTRAAMNLNSNFTGIVEKLGEIGKDRSQKDESLDQLMAELEELDIAAGKDSKDFKGQLERFDVKGLSNSFVEIRDKIKEPYEKLRALSLNFQKDTSPLFDGLKNSVAELKTQLDAMTEDVDTTVEALKTKTGEDKVAWQAIKDQHEAIGLLIPALKSLSSIVPSAVAPPSPEPQKDEVKFMANPDKVIKSKKDNADQRRKEIATELLTVSNRLALLMDVLTIKSNTNELIDARTKELDATFDRANALKGALNGVQRAIEEIITDAEKHIDELKVGNSGDNILAVYLKQLSLIDEKGKAILDLNAGIAQVKSPGDIKLYFGQIASILDQFPAPAKAIMDGTLNINEALAVLAKWAKNFKADLVNPLVDGFKRSSWNIVTKGPDSANSVWTSLREDLENKRLTDEDLRYTARASTGKKGGSRTEIIPVSEWIKEYTISSPDELASWKAFYTKKEVDLKVDDQNLIEEITFLNKFLEQKA